MRFAGGGGVALATALLLVQAAVFARLSRGERDPGVAPLSSLPERLPDWRLSHIGALDNYTERVLDPDDYLSATCSRDDAGPEIAVMVAYFRGTRTGHGPHSPRNCLPGSGWAVESSGPVALTSAGIEVHRSIVGKGRARAVVLYWYQTAHRAVADEYAAKLYLIADKLRYGRGDTALVRIAVSIAGGDDRAAESAAKRFGADVYHALHQHFNN